MSFHNHDTDEYNNRYRPAERKEQQAKAQKGRTVSKEKLEKVAELLTYSDRYEISVQFWPKQIAIYIAKDGVELKDFGGSFDFAFDSAINYFKRLNPTHP